MKEKDITFAIENGLIKEEEIQAKIEQAKREMCLQNHKYKIWLGSDNRWTTYLPDPQKKRRLVKRKDMDSLINEIVSCLKENENDPTVGEIYHACIREAYKAGDISDSTVDRYNRCYNRHFSSIENQCISLFTERTLVRFLADEITARKLDR